MSDYFDNFFFTSNLTSYECPGFNGFACQPPNACANDPNTGKRYCCDASDVCWTIPSACQSDGSTFSCGSGQGTWCCLDQTETCTNTEGQINICWSSAHDTLLNISTPVLNKTYSSLSSASPSASSWTFDPATLIAATQTSSKTTSTSNPSPSSISNSSSKTSAVSTSTPVTSSSAPTAGSSASISSGAIAGIVIGVVVVIALLALGTYLLKRRRNRKNNPLLGAAVYEADGKFGDYTQSDSKSTQVLRELHADYPASELPGNQVDRPPQELPANPLDPPHEYQK